jgi:hypothetical protein
MRTYPTHVLMSSALVVIVCGSLVVAAPASAGGCRTTGEDAEAKELARTAQTTAEVYATDHEGFYSGMTPQVVAHYEPGYLPTSIHAAARDHVRAFLFAALAIERGGGYIVRTKAFDGHTYSVMRTGQGYVTRSSWRCGRRYSW